MSKSSSPDDRPEDPGGSPSSSLRPKDGHDRMNSASFSSTETPRVGPPAADTQHGPPRVETEPAPSNATSLSTTTTAISAPLLTEDKDDNTSDQAENEVGPPIDFGLTQFAEQLPHQQGHPGQGGRAPSYDAGEATTMLRPTEEPQPTDPAERAADPLECNKGSSTLPPKPVPGLGMLGEVGFSLGNGLGLASSPDNRDDLPRKDCISSPAYQEPPMPDEPAEPASSDVATEQAVPPSSVPHVSAPLVQGPAPATAVTLRASPLLLSPAPLPQPSALLLPSPPAAAAVPPPRSAPSSKKRPRSSAAATTASTPSKKNRRVPTIAPSQLPIDGGSPLSAASTSSSAPLTAGRWTADEHRAFLTGLATYGREWKRVALHIPTRTSSQVRSHAQKYFTKLQQLQSQSQQQQTSMSSSSLGALEFRGEASTFMDPSSSLDALGSAPLAHGFDPNGVRPLSSADEPPTDEALTPSVRANVERILAQPETVQAEVDDTLQRLRERYRHLQQRLRQRQLQHRQQQAMRMRGDGGNERHQGDAPEEHDQASVQSNMSMEVESVCNSLQDSELIALHVLQGGLEHQSAAPTASSTSSSPSHDTSTLTNTVVHSQSGTNADANANEAHGGSRPTQGDGTEEKVQQQSQALREPDVDEEVRPNPQDPPSASNPYP